MDDVAPFVGAWIEMSRIKTIRLMIPSLRSSERGLKCQDTGIYQLHSWSLRSSERGLKLSCGRHKRRI